VDLLFKNLTKILICVQQELNKISNVKFPTGEPFGWLGECKNLTPHSMRSFSFFAYINASGSRHALQGFSIKTVAGTPDQGQWTYLKVYV